MIIKAILSLLFVLGLLLVTIWLIKYMQMKTPQNKFFKKLQDQQRIEVLENKRIDAKNSIILIKKDNKEYMLWMGVSQNLVIEAGIVAKKAENND